MYFFVKITNKETLLNTGTGTLRMSRIYLVKKDDGGESGKHSRSSFGRKKHGTRRLPVWLKKVERWGQKAMLHVLQFGHIL